jgi:glutamate 2,3-aminomutase
MVGGDQKAKDKRFLDLKMAIRDYLEAKNHIQTAIEDKEKVSTQKRKILQKLGAKEEDWLDYKWQSRNRFTHAKDIIDIIGSGFVEEKEMEEVGGTYRYAISPYYLSLIDPDNKSCPIALQSVPREVELDESGELDPMDEEGTSVEEIITRRYPDRLIIKVTNICGMYCRFCQRRRLIGECDRHFQKNKMKKAIQYVRKNPEIRDVLITGGDAFMLDDHTIDWILNELRKIPHVEIIRLGSRTLVTLPQRITENLVNVLKKYHPIYVNTQFNHPREISQESKNACEMLANAGIPLGNQMVLLKEINNDPFVVRKLNQGLLQMRVKPYYIFHPKSVKGTSHFWVSIQEGLKIIESLRGRTSGMAIPTYIVNGTGGLGKTPLLPDYILSMDEDKVVMRNWEGKRFEIKNPGIESWEG